MDTIYAHNRHVERQHSVSWCGLVIFQFLQLQQYKKSALDKNGSLFLLSIKYDLGGGANQSLCQQRAPGGGQGVRAALRRFNQTDGKFEGVEPHVRWTVR